MNDLTFIIPVRVDSEVRLRNLLMVLDYLLGHAPGASFIILEGDVQPKVTGLPEDSRIKYLFIEDDDPVFHRTRYLNRMTRLVRTAFLAVWDTDVLVSGQQIAAALEYLRSGEADFVFPYEGKLFQVSPFFQDIFKSSGELTGLAGFRDVMPTMFGYNSYGGCFIVNREKYIEAGMENEYFYGWGPEDLERVKRWEILGYNIRRVEESAFHFSHPVLDNSRSFNEDIGKQNNRELFRICAMLREELRKEVATWGERVHRPEKIEVKPEN